MGKYALFAFFPAFFRKKPFPQKLFFFPLLTHLMIGGIMAKDLLLLFTYHAIFNMVRLYDTKSLLQAERYIQ